MQNPEMQVLNSTADTDHPVDNPNQPVNITVENNPPPISRVVSDGSQEQGHQETQTDYRPYFDDSSALAASREILRRYQGSGQFAKPEEPVHPAKQDKLQLGAVAMGTLLASGSNVGSAVSRAINGGFAASVITAGKRIYDWARGKNAGAVFAGLHARNEKSGFFGKIKDALLYMPRKVTEKISTSIPNYDRAKDVVNDSTAADLTSKSWIRNRLVDLSGKSRFANAALNARRPENRFTETLNGKLQVMAEAGSTAVGLWKRLEDKVRDEYRYMDPLIVNLKVAEEKERVMNRIKWQERWMRTKNIAGESLAVGAVTSAVILAPYIIGKAVAGVKAWWGGKVAPWWNDSVVTGWWNNAENIQLRDANKVWWGNFWDFKNNTFWNTGLIGSVRHGVNTGIHSIAGWLRI